MKPSGLCRIFAPVYFQFMKVFFASLFIFIFSLNASSQSIHDFKALTISGDTLDFAQFKGRKIMIVNTASECGLTPQYKQLQEVYENYKDSGFVIIGFPSNDFMEQEPGSNSDIASFCEKNYGVSFQMMSKINVKGDNMADIYKFLTSKKLNGLEDNEVRWNFQKYLIDEEGKLVMVISPKILPNDPMIIDWIKTRN